jgi:hypothetical protein
LAATNSGLYLTFYQWFLSGVCFHVGSSTLCNIVNVIWFVNVSGCVSKQG